MENAACSINVCMIKSKGGVRDALRKIISECSISSLRASRRVPTVSLKYFHQPLKRELFKTLSGALHGEDERSCGRRGENKSAQMRKHR